MRQESGKIKFCRSAIILGDRRVPKSCISANNDDRFHFSNPIHAFHYSKYEGSIVGS